MPFVNVKVTRESEITPAMKAQVMQKITQALHEVLDKDPSDTYVVFEEIEPENWAVAGIPVPEWRRRKAAGEA